MDDALARLEDDDAEVRAAARMKLIAERAIEPLIAAFAAGGRFRPREAALGLAELDAKEALPPLIAALDEDGDRAIWAAHALGRIGDIDAVDPLIGKLTDEAMAGPAARALADLGSKEAVEPLRRRLGEVCDRFDFGSYLGRYWTAQALARLGDRSAATVEALKEVVDRDFGPETQQTWGAMRDTSVEMLVDMLGEGADPFLRPFLKRERETLQLRYRIARLYWLQGERPPEHLAILERMSRHPLYPALSAEARDLLATEH